MKRIVPSHFTPNPPPPLSLLAARLSWLSTQLLVAMQTRILISCSVACQAVDLSSTSIFNMNSESKVKVPSITVVVVEDSGSGERTKEQE